MGYRIPTLGQKVPQIITVAGWMVASIATMAAVALIAHAAEHCK